MLHNQSAPTPYLIVGTWRLTAFTEPDLRTGTVTFPFGQQAKAFVLLYDQGVRRHDLCCREPQIAVAAQGSDQEAIALYRKHDRFAGRYELVGEKLIYHPEISWNEAWNGTSQ